jgi:hypothetical protein
MIIREIGASLRALFTRLTAKTTTISGTEAVYLDDAGSSVKAALSDAIRYGGGSSARIATIGNANIHQNSTGTMWLEVAGQTAGNARGSGAFDWQATRSNATYVASGANSVALGYDNIASGIFSTAFGRGHSVSSQGAGCFGGYFNVAANVSAATVGGYSVSVTNHSQVGFGACPSVGRGQGNLQSFYTATTDASSTQLNITGSAGDRMVIPVTRSVSFIGIVQAMCNVSSSSNFVKAWEIRGVITRDGNNTTRIVGTPTITVLAQDADGTPTPSTWAIASITADDTNEALAINVTGQAGTTIRWQASLFYSQVGF